MDTRIPVTIITGFLGSGKTTLLNQLIKQNPKKKFAIIENEFGEIGIDGGLIVGADDNIFELSNGCICCSLNEGFYETIEKLLNSEFPFNHLLVETTGIADPDSIIKAFVSSKEIQENFRLDSVLCLADCANMEDLIDEQAEVRKQLALADVILLNKSETVQASYLNSLKEIILGINPLAKQYAVSYGDVQDVNLLELEAFTGKSIEKNTTSFLNMTFVDNEVASSTSILSNQHLQSKHQHHQHDIVSLGFNLPGSFDPVKFNMWMYNYLLFNKKRVFRVKGIVSFADMPEKLIFQAVRESYMLEHGDEWGSDSRFCKLVFIGKELDYDSIKSSLKELIISE